METGAKSATLPVIQHRSAIIQAYQKHDTLIVIGETGSGKTTQIPKFIYQDTADKNKMIAVTQPRRVAAIALAERVAFEMDCVVGSLVGYSVRFDEAVSTQTRIKYLTDGMLLREALSDRSLSRYSTIVLDEAHERTLRTDILFGLLKKLQSSRKLKIVIMSATLNPEKFLGFFRNPFVINIPGRQFPVKISYTLDPQQDYLDAAIVTIFQVHTNPAKKGDILVFLTGQEEIDTVKKILEEYGPQSGGCKMIIAPIYAALSSAHQMQVFRRTPSGCRKIVLATNIAETSITIPGIRYVIDPGFVKMRSFNPRVGMETLSVVPISKSSARQRAGRAGREGPGECYRLYVEEAFGKGLEEETAPEILRTALANVILTMKACGIEDVVEFDYLETPPLESVCKGLEELLALGALDVNNKLTAHGKLMSECPLLPSLSRVLLESRKLQCSDSVLSIISMLSVDNIFAISLEDRDQNSIARRNFSHTTGDHMTLLNIFNAYLQAGNMDKWCSDNFVDGKAMNQVVEIRKQLVGFCEKSFGCRKPVVTQDVKEPEVILKAFCAGFHTQIALVQTDRTFRTLGSGRQQVFIHPSSILHLKKGIECVLFHKVTLTTKCYMRSVSIVDPAWVSEYIGLGGGNE